MNMSTSTRTRKLPKVAQYVKNVGKSVVFASIEGVRQNTPGINSFIENNDEIFNSIYSSMKNKKSAMKNAESGIKQNNYYKNIEYGIKNIFEDLKTGNLYNKSRTLEESESILGIDIGDDYNDDDFYDDYQEDTPVHSSKKISDSFDKAISSAARTNASIVAKGTDMVVKGNKVSTTIISSEIQKSTATLHSGIGALYDSTNKINEFLNGPMMTHLDNSKKYYESSLEIMQEQKAMIKELLEMQRNLYDTEKNNSDRYRTSSIDSVMSYDGSVNLSGYFKKIKDNIKNAIGSFGFMGDMGIDFTRAAASAPLVLAIEGLMGSIMPKKFAKNLKELDSSITSLFSHFITKMNKGKDSSNMVMNILGQILGIDIENKKAINTSNYNKGPVPFDGITRKSIVEVIPGYLARIESALTGNSERHYDPYNGTWKNYEDIRSDFDKIRVRSIRDANSNMIKDTEYLIKDTRNKYGDKAADDLESKIRHTMEKIYDEGGYFNPSIVKDKNSKADSKGRRTRVSSGNAWKEYGFRSKAQFDAFLSSLTDDTYRNIAIENIQSKQRYSRDLEGYEASGGVYNRLFDNSYPNPNDKDNKKPSGFIGGNNLLSISKDSYGNNIFYYLREILMTMSARRSKKNKRYFAPRSTTTNNTSINAFYSDSNSREHQDSSESEGDPGYSDDVWSGVENDLKEEEDKEKEKKKNANKVTEWFKTKIEGTWLERLLSKTKNKNGETILDKPLDRINDMLEKANQNMFVMMFGERTLRDSEGNEVTSIFDYIIGKVKKTFTDLGTWIKKKLSAIFNPLWQKIKPTIDKYGKPVLEDIKSMGRTAISSTKNAFSNVFGGIFNKIPKSVADNIENGGVSSADEVENASGIKNSAYGRIATKRGLTMISPGEIIIPASFNKKEQDEMLKKEKKDRSRIYNAIGLNAKGNVSEDDFKEKIKNIFNENKSTKSIAHIGASGIVGAGAGVLTGINPVLGAMIGAGLSILNKSETFQKMIFGEEIDGEHKEGLIPKKIQDIFKKALPDIRDFGIVGGGLGLLTPFGPLGGAAIGAGIGLLKNSESFNKFIFGDKANGEEGLFEKESFDKFTGFVKKSAPRMLLGAGAGVLAGPFGILGNAAMGAGLGLLTSTDEFHNFIFGNKEEGTAGVLDAFNTGIIKPAKKEILKFAKGFKKYAKKNIIDQMKDFWNPFKQLIRNTITGTGDKIKDFVNGMFEKTLGLPMHDFLQEKIFRPLGNILFKFLKIPATIGKVVVAAPFRTIGAIGRTIQANQIRRGTHYNSSASERLAWRDKHGIRFNEFNSWRDKTRQQDEMLAGMTDEQLEELRDNAYASSQSKRKIQKQAEDAHTAVAREISGFFNTETRNGKNRFTKVGYKKVNKFTKLVQSGKLDEAEDYLINIEGLRDTEKNELRDRIREKALEARRASKVMEMSNRDDKSTNDAMQELIGRKFKGTADKRQLYRSAEAELKARKKASEDNDEKSPEVDATNNFADLYKEKIDKVLSYLSTTTEYLHKIADPKFDPEPGKNNSNNIKLLPSGKSDSTNADSNTSIVPVSSNKPTIWDNTTGNFITSNPDAKENVDNEKERALIRLDETKNREANEKTNSTLSKIGNAIFGRKKNDKESIISKAARGISKFRRFIGMTGLTLVGTSLFGHATEWFRISVLPKMKEVLFGKTNDDGTHKNGLLGGIANTGKKLFFGEDGHSGVLGNIKTWIEEKITKIKTWYESEGGFTGLLMNRAIPGLVNGWGYAINNVVAPLTAIIIKTLPSTIMGLGKAILEGMKIAIFKKQLPKSVNNIEIPEYSSVLKDTYSKVNSSIESGDKSGTVNSIKGSFKNGFDAYDTFKYEIDMSMFSSKNDKKSDSILGAFGQTERTNEIEFDENGNQITEDIARNNTADSALSKLAKATGRSFAKGLSGRPGKFLASKGTESVLNSASKAAADFIKPGIGSKIKATGGAIKTGIKTGKNILNISRNAGKYTNKTIQKLAKKSLSTATEAATKNGIISGIASIFKSIANSSIGGKIFECASKFTNNKVTKVAVTKALDALGSKLGNSLISKATKTTLKSLGNAVARYSPLALAIYVGDFIWGFDNAYTILGVARGDNYVVNLGQKCACGLVNLLTQNLTLGILPADTVMDIVVDHIFPLFGINLEELKEARDKANEILKQWNETHKDETYDNLQDYNNKDKWWFKLTSKVEDVVNNLFGNDSKNRNNDTHKSNSVNHHGGSEGGFGRNKNNKYHPAAYGFGRRDHNYQSDPAIAKMRYGNGTIGDSGCAPVAAANLINNMSGYKGYTDIKDAAKFAEKNNLINANGGTNIDYFKSYLGSKGIPTKTTDNRNDIMNALYNGNQVIMLGQDSNNRPGAPFGDNPHYVTATSISPRGNIIVEDPDLPQGSVEYNPDDMMNSMVRSVIAKTNRSKHKVRKLNKNYNKNARRSMNINKVKKAITYGRGNRLGAQAILNIARSQVGIHETGDNHIKYNFAYYGNKSMNVEWCVIFVWWVFNQAGASKLFYGGNKTASCSRVVYYYKNKGKLDKKNPKPGDLILFNLNKRDSYEYEHIGIVNTVSPDGSITSIEGNFDNKVGIRNVRKSDISGFCHIDYPYEYDPSDIVDMSRWGDNTDYESLAKEGIYSGGPNTSTSISGVENDNKSTGGTLISALTELGTNMIKKIFGTDAYEALFGSTVDNNSTNGGTEVTNTGSMAGNSTGQKIWNYLISRGYTRAGAAGMMGNLDAESGLRSNNLQNSYEYRLGSDDTYTARVNNKSYSRNSFGNDSAGYGLAQWTYHSRKKNLYDNTIGRGKSINDLGAQLDFLVHELENDYAAVNNVLRTTNNVNYASDTVLTKFERPAVLNYENRRGRSQRMLSTYGSGSTSGGDTTYDYSDFDSDYNESHSNDASNSSANTSGPKRPSKHKEVILEDDTPVKTAPPKPSKPAPSRPRRPGGPKEVAIGGFGRNDYSSFTGTAANSLNNMAVKTRRNNAITNIPNTKYIGNSDYATLLSTIIEILLTISSNTAMLNKVIEILSANYNININKAEIDKATKKSRDDAKKHLGNILESAGNASSIAKVLNSKDNQYLISAMSAIARE